MSCLDRKEHTKDPGSRESLKGFEKSTSLKDEEKDKEEEVGDGGKRKKNRGMRS